MNANGRVSCVTFREEQGHEMGIVAMTTSKSKSSEWERVGCVSYLSPRPEGVRDLWDQSVILSLRAHSLTYPSLKCNTHCNLTRYTLQYVSEMRDSVFLLL